MYENFGSNTDDVIYLGAVISGSDTEASMIAAYQARAGVTPLFPIVLVSGGARTLTDVFGQSNYGGPTWIVHCDGTYSSAQYSEAALTANIDASLADDCLQ